MIDYNSFSNENPRHQDAMEAVAHLSLMEVQTDADVYFYLSAINLLNRYVKVMKHDISYFFKNYLLILVFKIMKNKIKDIRIDLYYDSNAHGQPILMIDTFGVHFSFHDVYFQIIQAFADYFKYEFVRFEWDHIPKQPIALDLYRHAKEQKGLTYVLQGEAYQKRFEERFKEIESQSEKHIYIPYINLDEIEAFVGFHRD